MKLIYKGKYSGNDEDLPQREHPENYHAYKEPENMKKLAVAATVISLIICVAMLGIMVLRVGFDEIFERFGIFYLGLLAALVAVIPHEFLHALCFKEEVWMYQNFKQGMMFVIGTEDMSKAGFIFMSMLPNIVFGFIPFIIFLIQPSLILLGSLGALSIGAGAGDYINVFNTIVQVPKGAKVYMSGMHSYWYQP